MFSEEMIGIILEYGIHIPISTRKIIKMTPCGYWFFLTKVFTFSKIQCSLCKNHKRFIYYRWHIYYVGGIFCNKPCLNSFILMMQFNSEAEQIALLESLITKE
jgi:hypothetical protein